MKKAAAAACVVSALLFTTCEKSPVAPQDIVRATKGFVRGAVSLAGDIVPDAVQGAMVLVQNVRSGEVFQGIVDAAGKYDIPLTAIADAAADSSSYMLSVVSKAGKPLGTLTYKTASNVIAAGIDLLDGAVLDLNLPSDPLAAPLAIAGGAYKLAEDIVVRASAAGVPAGLASYGKVGSDSGSWTPGNAADPDGDGLPSVIDADDDGDGIADEFDPDTDAGYAGNSRVKVSLGFLLDLENEDVLDYYPKDDLAGNAYQSAPLYFGPSSDERRNLIGLTRDVRIDFWVQPENGVLVKSARLVGVPAPAYVASLRTGAPNLRDSNNQLLPPMFWKDKLSPSGAGYSLDLIPEGQPTAGLNGDRKGGAYFWSPSLNEGPSEAGFEDITQDSPRFSLGDTFTFEIEEEGGAKYLVSKMINFAFTKPFFFKSYGPSGGTKVEFSPSYSGVNNIWRIDPEQDLEIVFTSPLDEGGQPLVSGASFEIVMNYFDQGNQIQGIDWQGFLAANSIAPPALKGVAWDGRRWRSPQEGLGIDAGSADGEFTITIPKELLLSTVVDESGASHPVDSWIIGAAFMVGAVGSWDASTIQNRVSCAVAAP